MRIGFRRFVRRAGDERVIYVHALHVALIKTTENFTRRRNL